MKIFTLLFRLFSELIFASKEEYDFKSKHFRPSKVIFAGVVVMSFLLNFFLMTGLVRVTVKHLDLLETLEAQGKSTAETPAAKPDKFQAKGSSDSSKPLPESPND